MSLQNISLSQEKKAQSPSSQTHTSLHAESDLKGYFLKKFKETTRFYALFHIAFVCCGLLQILILLLFFSFFTKSTGSAIAIASLFLTGFTYFVLHFYFQAKKPQQFLEIRQEMQEILEQIASEKKQDHPKESLALFFTKLSEDLYGKEKSYYFISTFKTLKPIIEKFSIWMHWKDILKMRELLLLSSINEIVKTVKTSPTQPDSHAKLASAYIALAKIYMDPRKIDISEPPLWVSPEYLSQTMLEKFHLAADRAIEELNIIKEQAPQSSWTHMMLANIYHDKSLPDLEMNEYEALLELHPEDETILFRLGYLYFSQGLNAKGLKVYAKLKEIKEPLAEELIFHYDSFQFHDLSAHLLPT